MSFVPPQFQILPFPAEALQPRAYPKTAPSVFEGIPFLDECTPGTSRVKFLHAQERPIFFLGDLHGDILALEGILAAIHILCPDPSIVVLGDVIDRGPHQLEVVVRLLEYGRQHPGRLCIVNGDHEEGLVFDEEEQSFVSQVIPGEFVEQLNHVPGLKEFGMAFADFLAKLPVALFLADGVFASHGGIPHQDVLPSIESRQDLEEPDCIRDFIWNRLTDARRKRPNRSMHGTDFGYENLLEFCVDAKEFLTIEPRVLVCGHQHPFHGWRWVVADDTHGALCLYSSFFRTRIPGEERFGTPCFAMDVPGSPLRVFGLELPEEKVLEYYGRGSLNGESDL